MRLKTRSRILLAYTGTGFLLGCLFPLTAFWIDSIVRDVTLRQSLVDHQNPLFLMVDLGPILLAFVGFAAGLREVQTLKVADNAVRTHLESAERAGRFGSWEIDLETQEVWWSAGLYSLLDLDPRTPPSSQLFSDMMTEEGLQSLQSAIGACVAGETASFQSEYILNLKSGKSIQVRSDGAVDTRLERKKLVGVTRDITDLSAAREIALIADRERSMAEGITAAIITCRHEINNPLAAAIGTLELIEKTEETRESLSDVEVALWRIADIVQRMSELSAQREYKTQPYANSEQQMLSLGVIESSLMHRSSPKNRK